MTLSELQSIILRTPGREGNFTYRIAKFGRQQAEQWERRLAASENGAKDSDVLKAFGPPVDLSKAMELVDTRDFRVLELLGNQYE